MIPRSSKMREVEQCCVEGKDEVQAVKVKLVCSRKELRSSLHSLLCAFLVCNIVLHSDHALNVVDLATFLWHSRLRERESFLRLTECLNPVNFI